VASLLLMGGRVIDPASPTGQAGRDEVGDLVIEGGRIARIGPPGFARAEPGFAVAKPGSLKGAERVLDCRGRIVSPGFIDLHVHFREPPFEGGSERAGLAETIATGAASAVGGGFTAAEFRGHNTMAVK